MSGKSNSPVSPAPGELLRLDIAAAEQYTADILEDEQAFLDLREEWRDLHRRCPNAHFFHDFAWKWQSWRCIASRDDQQLRLLVGRERGRLVLVFPLVIKDRVARFLNSGTFEYRDLLVDTQHVQQSLLATTWRAVKSLEGVDILAFQNVRGESNLAKLLQGERSKVWCSETTSPVINLESFSDWEHYADSRPRKLMADQRRQWRRIRKQAPELAFEIIEDSAELQATLTWLIEAKTQRLEEQGAAQMLWRGDRSEFLRCTALDALADGRLLAVKLVDADKIISAGFGFVDKQRFTFEMFAFDADWQAYSPSRLLQEMLMRRCFDMGIREFDFLPGGASAYKQLWATDQLPCKSYVIPTSIRGSLSIRWQKLAAWFLAPSSALSNLYQRTPGWLRRPLRQLLVGSLSGDLLARLSPSALEDTSGVEPDTRQRPRKNHSHNIEEKVWDTTGSDLSQPEARNAWKTAR